MKKKYSITLLEIMIVILLIGLIGSVVGYNMKGSLDKGKAFKSQKGAEKLHEILLLEADLQQVELSSINQEKAEEMIENSGLAKSAKDLLKDGWQQPYTIAYNPEIQDLTVTSSGLQAYQSKKESSGTSKGNGKKKVTKP